MISEEFKAIIDEDITKCECEIKSGNKESRGILHNRLISKYGKIIDGFKDDLNSLFYDDDGTYRIRNLETMRQKLLVFKAMGYENIYSQCPAERSLTINNTNNIEANINISFSDARTQVENMSSLREEEIQEIISKINELEKIINSSERKTKKWDNVKEHIKWIADKSIDVALVILPLIMRIGQMQK